MDNVSRRLSRHELAPFEKFFMCVFAIYFFMMKRMLV